MSAFLVPFGALLGPFALVSVMSAQGQGGLVPLRGPFALGALVGVMLFVLGAAFLESKPTAPTLWSTIMVVPPASGIVAGWLLRNTGRLWSVAGPFAATASFAFMGAVNIWGALVAADADHMTPSDMAYLMLLGSFGVWLTLFPVLLLACVIGLFFFRPRPNPYGGQA